MSWYAVERRYRVADHVYVEAQTASEAEQKVRDTEYEYVTEAEPLGGRWSMKARKRNGVPRWIWEDMGYPDDVVIES